MKTIIVYYSYSGNTKKVAGALSEYLRRKGQVDIIELKGLDESNGFFDQVARAFIHKGSKRF
jgi:flavodoxin